MTFSDECQYWLTESEQCGRRPIAADYFDVDPLIGERLITSNCARHDNAAARRFAMARGYERRDRGMATPVLTRIEGGVA